MKRAAGLLAVLGLLLVAAKEPEQESEHVVLAGETLMGIATRAQVPRVLIAEANGLKPPYRLRAGQKLTIPRTRRHTVVAGDTGFSIVLDDATGSVTISDLAGTNQVEVSLATGTVTLKGLARVVSTAPLVQHGSGTAAHPAVLGDQLMAYLTTLVSMLNVHVHPGELALGVLPVTPAPPQPTLPPPPASILSTKVLLE